MSFVWFAGLVLLGIAWGVMLRNNYICFKRYPGDIEEVTAIPRLLIESVGLVGTFTFMTAILLVFCVIAYILQQYTFPGMLSAVFVMADIYELNIVKSLREREKIRECLEKIPQIKD